MKSDDEEEIDLQRSDDEDFVPEDPLGSPGEVHESSSSDNPLDEDFEGDELVEKQLRRGAKRKLQQKATSKRQKTLNAGTIKKIDDKIFHLSNCYGSVRINAKTVPKIKSGVFFVAGNPTLMMLSPLLCKKKVPEEQPGLVIITNDIWKNRPGVRKRQGFKIQEETAKHLAPNEAIPDEVEKETTKTAPKTSFIKLFDPPEKSKISTVKTVKVPATVNNQPAQKIIQTAHQTNNKSALSQLMTNSTLKRPSPVLSKTTKPVVKTVAKEPAKFQTSPQHVEIPQGVDPEAVEVPAGMQLMVSDTGEYYLLPQQPEGSTVALAQDPDSGVVQVVAIPEQNVAQKSPSNSTIEVNPPQPGTFTAVAQEGQGITNFYKLN